MRHRLALLMVLLPILMMVFACGLSDYGACLLTCEASDNYGNCAAVCCAKWPTQCAEEAVH